MINDTFDTRVRGIPCQIKVTRYEEDQDGVDLEYQILDRRGRRADWLESKLSTDDDGMIRQKIHRFMEQDEIELA